METWLDSDENFIIEALVPKTHRFSQFTRDGRGGVVGVMVAKYIKVLNLL